MSDRFWSGVYGHEHAKIVFESLIRNNKIPSGIILTGPPGIGADYLALKFSHLLQLSKNGAIPSEDELPDRFEEPYIKYIFALMRGTNETPHDDPFVKLPTKDLESVKEQIRYKNTNPYHEIEFPKANEIKINSIRSIKGYLSLDYSDSAYRTILISKAEMMSDNTQNALLKSLEEPPEHVMFILTTSQPTALLPTIRSRCWEIKLSALTDDELAKILINHFNYSIEDVTPILAFASGNISEGLRLLNSEMNAAKEKGIEILRNAMAGNFNRASEIMDGFTKEAEEDSLNLIFKFLIAWFSDAFRHKKGQSNFLLPEFAATYIKFVDRYPHVKYEEIIKTLETLHYNQDNSYMNKNGVIAKLFFELYAVTNPDIKYTNQLSEV